MASNVYITRADLMEALGLTGITAKNDEVDLACIIASRWVDYRTGVTTYTATQEDATDGSYTLTYTASNPAIKQATMAAASRFYKAADVPFGVAGGLGDLAVHIKTHIPEAELILLGQRTSWGIA